MGYKYWSCSFVIACLRTHPDFKVNKCFLSALHDEMQLQMCGFRERKTWRTINLGNSEGVPIFLYYHHTVNRSIPPNIDCKCLCYNFEPTTIPLYLLVRFSLLLFTKPVINFCIYRPYVTRFQCICCSHLYAHQCI